MPSLLRAWAIGLGFCSAALAHAVPTAPTVNLGTVATFATFTDTDPYSYRQAYDRLFTFTLASDATVRIDMRQIGNSHWLDNNAGGLTDVSFSLLGTGTAAIDPAFNGTHRECMSGPKCLVRFAEGRTLSAELAAGTYTMELTGVSLGSRQGPGVVLNLGVMVVGVGDQAAYFNAVTPATNLPEPGSWALMGLGLLGVAAAARARRTKA